MNEAEVIIESVGETLRNHHSALMSMVADVVTDIVTDKIKDIPPPIQQIIVDMTPVAQAIDRMTDAISLLAQSKDADAKNNVVDRLADMVTQVCDKSNDLIRSMQPKPKQVRIHKDDNGDLIGEVK